MPTTGDMQEPRATVSRPPEDDAPHLLLVDDDTRIRTLLRRFLSENGFRITAARVDGRRLVGEVCRHKHAAFLVAGGGCGAQLEHARDDAENCVLGHRCRVHPPRCASCRLWAKQEVGRVVVPADEAKPRGALAVGTHLPRQPLRREDAAS